MAATANNRSAVGETIRLFLVLCGSLLAITELFYHGLPLGTHDGTIHLFRLLELSASVESGDFFPRLAPDMALGYGYATMTFYPPTAVYLGEAFHLFGLGYIASLKACFAAGSLLGAFGMYLLGRDLYGWRGGMLAAIGYAYVPYQLLTLYVRGDVAECIALGESPVVIWATLRVCNRPARGRVVFAGTALALLIMTHLITTLIVSPILVGVVLVTLLAKRPAKLSPGDSNWWSPLTWRELSSRFLAIGVVMALAAVIAAGYWLPVLLGLPHLNSTFLAGAFFDYHNWYIPVSDLIERTWVYAYRWSVDEGVQFNLGRAQVLLIAVASGWSVFVRPIRRPLLILAVTLILMYIWMQQSGSVAVWEGLRVMRFVQFPFRLGGPLGILTALLVGSMASSRSAEAVTTPGRVEPRAVFDKLSGPAGLILGFGGLAIFAYASVIDLPRKHDPVSEAEVTVPVMLQYERDRKLIGGGTGVDYLPDTVTTNLFAPIQRSRGNSPNPGVTQLSGIEVAPLRLVANTSSLQSSTLTFDRLAYPGWLATIDGMTVPTKVIPPLGLLGVDVPGGNHRLAVWYDAAPGDTAGRVLSGIGLTTILLVLIGPRRSGWTYRAAAVVATLGLSVAIGSTRLDPPRYVGGSTDFGEAARLVGATVERPPPSTPGAIELNLIWEARRAVSADCTVRVRLIDSTGRVAAQRDKPPEFGLRPCSGWYAGDVVHDLEQIRLPPGESAGTYRLAVGLSVGGVDLTPVGDTNTITWRDSLDPGSPTRIGLDLGSVQVPNPPTPLDLPDGTIIGTAVGGTYQLAATSIRRHIDGGGTELEAADGRFIARVAPYDSLTADILWRSLADSGIDTAVFTQLLDANSNLIVQDDGWPDYWKSPTMTWFPGDTVVDHRLLGLSKAIEPGLYHLVVGMYDSATKRRLPVNGPRADHDQVVLGTVKVVNSTRTFGHSAPLNPQQIRLGGAIDVIGTAIEPTTFHPGDMAKVRIGWYASTQPMVDYTVFVHLINQEGQLVAQHDRPPLQGTFPTTAWDLGDTIYDSVDLALPANLPWGTYQVNVGLYQPEDGARLSEPGGGTEVVVGDISVR